MVVLTVISQTVYIAQTTTTDLRFYANHKNSDHE